MSWDHQWIDEWNSNEKTWRSQKCQQENEVVHYLLWEGGRGRKPNQSCHRARRGDEIWGGMI